ncbi:MAG: class II glutamine amidotransferase, partial [SAR324 cluster bacterium]|nr:class II glutamine amidotransferase [SAR324 cluster bacterium]
MCGISAVTGRQDVVQVLYESIKNLEYRGYDSCGIGVIHNKELSVRKNTGGVEEVNNKEHLTKMKGKIGIAHTRWATHGKVDQVNAHPHTSNDGCFTIVHNGIISNYMELREELGNQGVTFVSATDTEVVVQLVSLAYAEFNDVEEAFVAALKRLEGYYALAMLSAHQPDTIYCAREGSPLVIGIAEDKNFVSSDVNAFLPYTREALMFEDGEYAVIEADSYS